MPPPPLHVRYEEIPTGAIACYNFSDFIGTPIVYESQQGWVVPPGERRFFVPTPQMRSLREATEYLPRMIREAARRPAEHNMLIVNPSRDGLRMGFALVQHADPLSWGQADAPSWLGTFRHLSLITRADPPPSPKRSAYEHLLDD